MKRLMYIIKYIKQNPIIITACILFTAIISRSLFICYNPVGHDEPFSIFHAQMNVSEIINALKGGNNPPLYELFLHYWIKLFGLSTVLVRLPSLIFSVLNIYFVFLIGKKFFNLKVAILAALMITFSSYHIYFSHEARVYSLFSLLTSITFYLLFEILNNETRLKYYIQLFLIYVLLIYSHYLGVLVIGLQIAIMVLWNYKNTKRLRYYLIAITTLIFFFSFYIPEFYSRIKDFSVNGTWLKPVENLGHLHHMMYLFTNKNRYLYLVIVGLFWLASWMTTYKMTINVYLKRALLFFIIPLFFLVSYSIFFSIPFIWKITSINVFTIIFLVFCFSGLSLGIFKYRKAEPYKAIIFTWFFLPYLSMFAISFYYPIFHDRYLIFIISPLYIGIALIIERYFKNRLFYVISGIVLLVMILTTDFKRTDNKGISKTIVKVKSLKTDSTKVIICPYQYRKTFTFHYDKALFKEYNNLDQHLKNDKIYAIYNASSLSEIIDSTSSHVLFLDAHSKFLYPNNAILDSLKIKLNIVEQFEYKDSLVLYNLKLKR